MQAFLIRLQWAVFTLLKTAQVIDIARIHVLFFSAPPLTICAALEVVALALALRSMRPTPLTENWMIRQSTSRIVLAVICVII